jgi:hypothetical protein
MSIIPTAPHYEAGIGRIVVLGQPRSKTQDPIQKITKTKRAWGVAQVVEHLPSKCKALCSSSNPSTNNKKKVKIAI